MLQVAILLCFVTELVVRNIAKGRRFWQDPWCIFDVSVISLSMLLFIVRQVLPIIQGDTRNEDLQTASGSTNTLRILSRVAQGLRLLRVVIHIRHARQLSGKVQGKLRGLVSQNRRRFIKHGFDLDCTYITNRVIAMSAPVFGRHSTYRNDIHVVSRFLAYMHYGNIFVVNLCDTYYSSDGLIGQYHPRMLFNKVQRIPIEDHSPPLLVEVVRFCEDVAAWMRSDKKNVIVAHCKGGKGRTGLFLSAFLLWSGHRRTALDALELFTFRRTENYSAEIGLDSSLSHGIGGKQANQTVEGPSQIRYVHYVEAVLYCDINPFATPKMALLKLSFLIGPKFRKRPWYISFSVACMRAPILDSNSSNGNLCSSLFLLGGDTSACELAVNTAVWGDVRIDFFRHSDSSPQSNRKLAFFLGFHTGFYHGKKLLCFPKAKLDILCKDHKHKLTDENFAVTLDVSDGQTNLEQIRIEARFCELVARLAFRVKFAKGDFIIKSDNTKDAIFVILSGTVEGVVEESVSNKSLHPHPLGQCLSIPQANGRASNLKCSQGNQQKCATTERLPFACMLGPGSVIGTGHFLAYLESMPCRAHTEVEAYMLTRQHTAGLREPRVCSSLRVHMRRASAGDFDIGGADASELADLYRGLAVNIATHLSRVQAEVIRVGSLRAFSDRQTVMVEMDEGERLRVDCVKRFSLPMNERLLLKAKCHYNSTSGSIVRGNSVVKMRLILLANYIVFDPAFYGPKLSATAACYQCSQVPEIDFKI
mmetsp:Transcript_55748/g.116628  ORF Transcript_55748/g.116628 Transcript_55748/m.116628 type:complete len:760 (-) Transcript_55748:1370-3649(-)